MTDPQTLLDQAKCYMCLGVTLAEALELALLDQISSGGAAVSTQVTSGHGPPTSTPITNEAIYFDKDTGIQYNWYDGAWH